jgi:hypothetical protein
MALAHSSAFCLAVTQGWQTEEDDGDNARCIDTDGL